MKSPNCVGHLDLGQVSQDLELLLLLDLGKVSQDLIVSVALRN